MKTIFKIMACFMLMLSICACSNTSNVDQTQPSATTQSSDSNSDALKFKEEYESLNGLNTSNNLHQYREVTIREDNPFVYASMQDVVERINNDETLFIYFGFNSCPWCRSMIENLISVAADNAIATIYYVDVKETRDEYELDENNELKLVSEGDSYYQQLISLLDNVLQDYTLEDEDGNTIEVGEKRIYAPNFVGVVDGKAVGLCEGVSSLQESGYSELTDEMNQDSKDSLQAIFDAVLNSQGACNVAKPC